MPRIPKDTDPFTTLRGYIGQVGAIWEYAPRTVSETEYIMGRLADLKGTAIIRTGMGVWRIFVEGNGYAAVFPTREAALAAISVERGCGGPK